MGSIAMSLFLDSEFGVDTELPKAGDSLENPLVFDSSARELHGLAQQGRVKIRHEQVAQIGGESLIDRLSFRRLN